MISALAFSPIEDVVDGASQFLFFKVINDFLRDEIDYFQWNLLSSAAYIIGTIGITVLSVWIAIQGYRVVTGQSRQPMMALVGDSLRAVLIMLIATTAAASSSSIYWAVTDGMTSAISGYVTQGSKSPFQAIDDNLGKMQAALILIDGIDTGGKKSAEDALTRDRWFTGIGIAGPSVIGAAMLLLNKIALALFVGFGPIFILCLLFDQTKQLFSKWLLYGIGTTFSLAVLSVMVSIAMKMLAAVTTAFAAKYYAGMNGIGGNDGINSLALQQGGLGLLLSTLIVMAPPMAAAFFQGTLGQFASYSSFGTIGGGGGYGARQQALAQGRIPPAHAPRDDTRPQTNLGESKMPTFNGAASTQSNDAIRPEGESQYGKSR
jgi:type IV secretion system protein VirB6